ncbi:DUF1990 domain-containing protein [Nocardiopsis exhalans]|uniref:DUF1990 domain-containing protein n=1 Tax=Nocardiopsis exhalans TaxID=163604 RepID=A0ABY5D078_9ACTN|nr:DUF1990 domain-containing protein [Nocardiopsis exhalans]USY17272.1 DUF1990 domain-containing protein [Nocardiopsis exhalans]
MAGRIEQTQTGVTGTTPDERFALVRAVASPGGRRPAFEVLTGCCDHRSNSTVITSGNDASHNEEAAGRTSGDYSYSEVGATRALTLPSGYKHLRQAGPAGRGMDDFHAAAEALMCWDVHRNAGLTVRSGSGRARAGTEVVLELGMGPLRVRAPCRVIYTVDEPRRRGFAYGTLDGHPERGEELFCIEIDTVGNVRLSITAFSTPALWWSRLASPLSRAVQHRITDRYLRALAPKG